MVKTPAEYFADLDLHLSGKDAATAPLSRAEQSFVEKYLGPDALAGIPVITAPESLMQGGAAQAGVQAPPQDAALVPAPAVAAADSRPALVAEEASDVDEAEDQRRLLFSAAEIQLVSVRIAGTSFLLPIMAHFGWDPVWFGVMMTINLALGQVTPPVAVNLYVGAKISNLTMEQITPPVLPMLGAATVALLIIMLFPDITLFLPRLLGM